MVRCKSLMVVIVLLVAVVAGDCEIYYLLGNVYDEWNNAERTKEFYEKATTTKRHKSR